MGRIETFAAAPAAAVSRVLATFDRQQLEGFIAIAIDLLDLADGDPDMEDDDRAGETIGVKDDPDVPPEEEEGDPDLEQTMDEDDWYDHPANGPGCPVSDPGGACEHEDDEEDDDPGQCTEDEISTLMTANYGSGAGCPISDPDIAVDDYPCDEINEH